MNKSIFQTRDLATNFHKHVNDSHHWIETYSSLSLSMHGDFSSISSSKICDIYNKWKKHFAHNMRKLCLQNILSKSPLIIQIRWHCSGNFCAVSWASFMVIIIFHTLQSRSPEGLVFQKHRRIICMYNKTEETLRQERKARSFVRTTIRKDKVNISSESVYLPFFLENMPRNIRYFAVMEKMKENNLLFSEHLTSFSYRYRAFRSVSFCFYKYFYYFLKRCKR